MAGTSKSTERLVNIIVCVGAAVVIFGAWAKILHKPFADIMLTLGLLTEAAIFLVYAFLPPPGAEMAALAEALPKMSGNTGNPALQNLDKMMQEADITPTNLKRLSDGFNKLGTTVNQMKDVSDVVAATNDYAVKTKEAAGALGQMKDAYVKSAATMQSFNDASESTKMFHGQVQTLTKNLGSLNTIYELELQDTNNHLKAMNKFYGNLAQASEAMQGSVEDAKKTQDQIAMLAKNLGNLNQIYGNMLNAMQGRA
ncbi:MULTISPECIES: gliding motility protein GldL [unclassified Flavihumibacter]|uniref:type IX secretion system motor protein PorL/GldL n=1 Tax=unclassified Flavihumibacter TaxID=2621068 RepID=UPI00057CAB82|nr:gliding motility protein GldL [Flavihumibacter sp. ZG627]KIC92351.1 gliding motility-associated protein GldL [Flavihumibacter sp. ZG627]MCG7856149.1 gliding motility protein GldL [Flavihumibacter sediminis]